MIVVASENGKAGIQASIDVLRAGGSAVDAVEAGIRLVETPADHSVAATVTQPAGRTGAGCSLS
ncbi:MAG: isoaspartyl peptidase/L-asparaginase [Ardenticatenales bacterium]|nr:isoaspartyl peptidase/L-asparaginase [Ardenticatenales bacterium]